MMMMVKSPSSAISSRRDEQEGNSPVEVVVVVCNKHLEGAGYHRLRDIYAITMLAEG